MNEAATLWMTLSGVAALAQVHRSVRSTATHCLRNYF